MEIGGFFMGVNRERLRQQSRGIRPPKQNTINQKIKAAYRAILNSLQGLSGMWRE